MQKGRVRINYDQRRARSQYSQAVDEWLKAESDHRREVLAWWKRVWDLKPKLSVSLDAEAQTRKSNTELAVCLVSHESRRLQMTDVLAGVVVPMDGLGTGAETIVVRMDDLMAKLQMIIVSLIFGGPRATFEELHSIAVVYFTAACVDTSAVPGAGSVPTGEVVSTHSKTPVDLNFIPLGSVSLPTKAGDGNSNEETVDELIGDINPSHS